MADNNSPIEKMSLRRTIKPPRPFTGDVMDDLSSSIQGDRTLDSSEMEQIPSPPVLATNDRSLGLKTSTEKIPPKNQMKSRRKRASSSGDTKPSKVPRLTREDSERPVSRGRSPTRSGVWRAGAGMTPANNKRYLGPQTEFNPNLPPARFPTYTSDQYIEDKAAGRNITPDSTSSPKPGAGLSENDAVTEYEESSSGSEEGKDRKENSQGQPKPSSQSRPRSTTTLATRDFPTPASYGSTPTASLNDPEGQTPSLPRPYVPTPKERQRIDRGVSAAVNCDPLLRSGTSLTQGGGLWGLRAYEMASQGPFAADMTYEEWRRMMARRSEGGEPERPVSTDEEDILDDNIFGDGFVSSQRRR